MMSAPPTSSIYQLKKPICTRGTLSQEMRILGVKAGDTILLHSSLSSIGFVVGGAETVVAALLDILGVEGTLVVPSFSCTNSDPSTWNSAPVSLDVDVKLWPTIRASIPPYDARITRTFAVGVIPETVRTWPGAMRSAHPQTSFTAIGTHADKITSNHAINSCFGEDSPLAVLEALDARILLLGVGYNRCTSFHLAEGRVRSPRTQNSFAIHVDGIRQWRTVEDTVINGDDFELLGAEFERESSVSRGITGAADCALFSLPEATEFAKKWFKKHR